MEQNLLPIGATLRDGHYRVERHLGSGGFGNTYVVRNTAFDELFAMKEFFMQGINMRDGLSVTVSVPDNRTSFQSQREKFKKEALRLRKLKSGHIVHVHDMFEENDTVYYVMDYIDGISLSALLKKRGAPLLENEVIRLLPQILDALETVHAQHIWHLDIKPGNIMIDQQGTAFLIDFGASKQMDASGGSATSSALCYTPGYAPMEQVEQAMNKFGPWTDFYALGATLYTLLTNELPPSMSQINEGTPIEYPQTVSPAMRSLIEWMMNISRTRRPQSVAEIRQRLVQNGMIAASASATGKSEETIVAGNSEDTVIGGNSEETVVKPSPQKPIPPRPLKASSGGSGKKILLGCLIGGGVLAAALVAIIVLLLVFWDDSDTNSARYQSDYYYELVNQCTEAIDQAEDPEDFDSAQETLDRLKEMDSLYYLDMPDVYNRSYDLSNSLQSKRETESADWKQTGQNFESNKEFGSAYYCFMNAYLITHDEELKTDIERAGEKAAYMNIMEVTFSNTDYERNTLTEAGQTLYSDKMRYLGPYIKYESLLPVDVSSRKVTVFYKIIKPDGEVTRGDSSPYGYTNKVDITIEEGENTVYVLGWGNSDTSIYSSGQYRFELYHNGNLLHTTTFTIY